MQATADYWSFRAQTGYAPNWFSLCAREIVRRVSGQTEIPATRFLVRQHIAVPIPEIMEIGCLSGDKLASFLDDGFALKATGVDYAAAAIERGREKHGDRIDLRIMDLNRPEPMGQTFNMIHANGVLHHIGNLEACSDWLAQHLAPSGVIVASEFTGPVRYRYSRREIDLINEGVSMLPEELREQFDPASLHGKLAADPSESIRSRDIPDVLRAAGFAVELRPYGGNVLQRALSKTFFKMFDPASNSHMDALEMIVQFDEDVMRLEPSHHHFIVARHL